ncbi:Hypothetical protein (Fragment) [Durusdinium trenchii]|uniref:Thioredoxin domain-containing protein n=1 Tax=Durusdinium trenchii TaxID=1381693 RepID=A0ABP0I3X8_9DINO
MYKEQFEAMAKSYPKYSFYTCDVDDAPLAAYDAEVTEVPSVVIQPLGLKPDGQGAKPGAGHQIIPNLCLCCSF